MAPSLSPRPRFAKLAGWVRSTWRRIPSPTKGKAAEILALAALLTRGYRPFPRPKTALAQTDLLLTKGTILALVEVKARSSAERAALALTPGQKSRLARQAQALAAAHPGLTVRVDLLTLTPTPPFIKHIKNILHP